MSVNNIAVAEAIGNLENTNLETQLNNELSLVNLVEGFLEKEEGWTETLNEDAEYAYIATLESGSDPSKSAEAASYNEKYNKDSAQMQNEEGMHNKMVQRGKTALSNSTSAMSNNYELELPINNENTMLNGLIKKMMRN